MSYNTLKLEIEEAVAILTLNRPDKRNGISPRMIAELLEALDEVENGWLGR